MLCWNSSDKNNPFIPVEPVCLSYLSQFNPLIYSPLSQCNFSEFVTTFLAPVFFNGNTIFFSYWFETSDRSLRQPLIIVTWSFSDLLLNKSPVALRWAWLVQPITGLPTDSASAVFDSEASAGSFRVGAATQNEEDTLKQETDITKKYNYHKNQTRHMVMEQEAGDSYEKPVWKDLCWPEQQKEALPLCRGPPLRNVIRVITRRKNSGLSD